MTGSTFGKIFKVTTWGESHGKALGVVIDGVPPGIAISSKDIQKELNRRKPGQSQISTSRNEKDIVEILSGVFDEKTTGAPISMVIWNQDADSSAYEYMKHIPRPGHADFAYDMKYGVGIRDYKGGGRSSARETVARVAAGAVAKLLLNRENIKIVGHVISIGDINAKEMNFENISLNVEKTPVRCADIDAAHSMMQLIERVKEEGDSLGGKVEVLVKGIPAGLGEPVFDKLDADISKAMMSIGSVKGIEFGAGFNCISMKGSEMNDEITVQNGTIEMTTNNAGGILGGISTGMPIICRLAIKPTPSISKVQKSINSDKMEEAELFIRGRHDPTIPPRIVPVAEAMMALVLVDHLLLSGLITRHTTR